MTAITLTAAARPFLLGLCLATLCLAAGAQEQQAPMDPEQLRAAAAALAVPPLAADARSRPYSPYADEDFPRNLYWGDLHVHTSLSADAYSIGNRALDHATAYRYAKGEVVESASGQPARLSRPLDFLLISDHAAYLGLVRAEAEQLQGEAWTGRTLQLLASFINGLNGTETVTQDAGFLRSVWREIGATADRHNEPGRFTAFIGYEWTAQPGGNNLHRNVLFRDAAARTNRILPFSGFDSLNPEDLWAFLASYEAMTGGRALAIPHNGNLSNGAMFADRTFDGDPLTAAYAEMRMRWEPIIEATQEKGDGETHPALSPDDDFADFETWDQHNIAGTAQKQPWMLQHEYARSALKLGLQQLRAAGGNPFKFGLTGSSDAHQSLAGAEENNFFGKFAKDEPTPSRTQPIDFVIPPRLLAASGYTGIWARENTRAALFDALQRKEVYATTGPRMKVRFFGGWAFGGDDHRKPDLAAIGYAKGVPMGGDLPPAPMGKSPSFLIGAQKDALGANLDRVQVVKGWVDEAGMAQEQVHDVALSDGRTLGWFSGKAPPLPSTVDLETATYTNTVGAPELTAVWQDPDFNPSQPAFYYVRVLEIKTPRWSTHDAVFYGFALPEDLPAVIQDRAYTSPIWYTPSLKASPR